MSRWNVNLSSDGVVMNQAIFSRYVKHNLPPSMVEVLRTVRSLSARAGLMVKGRMKRRNLIALATLHACSKWGPHWYAQHYEKHFFPLRHKKLNILEIGVGGYDDPYTGGKSLRMWSDFFPNSYVFGIDVHPKRLDLGHRIKVFQGDQTDKAFLHAVVEKMGGVDIVIDDGSHINDHTIKAFGALFPRLRDGGIYVIEDVNSSYWPSHGGDSHDLNNPATIMNFLKRRVDGLNHKEFVIPGYVPDYYDAHITAMHFYHNLVFVYKGHNTENSIRDRGCPEWLALNDDHRTHHTRIGASVGGEPAGKRRESNQTVIEINSQPIAEQGEGVFSEGVALLVRSQDGTIHYWSKAAEELYGWSYPETVGSCSHRLLKTIFPKPLATIESELIQTRHWEGELVHKRRDGSEVKVVSQWKLLRSR